MISASLVDHLSTSPLHHSSLSILGNAFLTTTRLAGVKSEASVTRKYKRRLFVCPWPPSGAPVEEVNSLTGLGSVRGEAKRNT